MRISRFALALILLLSLAILAVAYYMPALRQDITPRVSPSPIATTEAPAAMAGSVPDLALTPDLTLPVVNLPAYKIPRVFDSKVVFPTIMPTPVPTAVQPCPTPMKPMDPWQPMAAMTPMVA